MPHEGPKPDPVTGKLPPHNFEVEMGLLAAILANNRVLERFMDVVQPHHFADSRHHRIYQEARKLVDAGKQANAFTLKNVFETTGELAEIGGTAYLAELQAAAVTIINARDYALLIVELWQRRRMIEIAQEMMERAHYVDHDTPAVAHVAEMEHALGELQDSAHGGETSGSTLEQAGAQMLDAYAIAAASGGLIGIPTGLKAIDKAMGGLEGSNLYVIGARPSMGKTALVTRIAENVAIDGEHVLFFQLEMSAMQIARRMAAARAGINIMEVKRARLDGEPWRRLVDAESEIRRLPITIVDKAGMGVAQIRARARRAKRQGRLGLIIVDHLTLMSAPPEIEKQGMVVKTGYNSGQLKRLAKDLDVPVILLCQLNRANENREDKMPQLADLRWAGEIEQDADVVMFVHRESYYLKRTEPARKQGEDGTKYDERHLQWSQAVAAHEGKAQLFFAKQRDAAVTVEHLAFDEATARFSNQGGDDV